MCLEFKCKQMPQTCLVPISQNGFCFCNKLFTSKELSFIPIGRIVTRGGIAAVRAYYESLGQEFVDALNDMIVLDAIICNSDRHFGNLGVMVDSDTNKIVAPAPLFDHGNSLFNFAGRDALESEESFQEYVDTLLPCVYDEFTGGAKFTLPF